jgi:hypothetical protein
MSTNGEIDEQLERLAIAAQQHKPKTLQRRTALTKLYAAIEQFQIVGRPPSKDFSRETYEAIYTEAKQDLMLCIFREIDKYNPSRGTVRQWVNLLMNKRCINEAIPKILGPKGFKTLYYGDLDVVLKKLKRQNRFFNILPLGGEDDSDRSVADIREMIAEDPGDVFKSAAIKKYPHVNFQMLLLKRLDDVSWQQISEEFGVKVPTLSCFFQRCLQKFTPRFREYL